MDDLAKYNRKRWEDLAKANIAYSRPFLDLNRDTAWETVDPEEILRKRHPDLKGFKVLCLAAGGGQQSAAFALLGADTTVLDLSETQLDRDRQAAEHYGLNISTLQGDMRDLSRFDDNSFDLVWHAHSLNFVPDARQVFRETSRILKPGGLYRLNCTNPFVHDVWEEWNGSGYSINKPYKDGEIHRKDHYWDVEDENGEVVRVKGPREFRHTLGTLVNGMIECRFILLGIWEENHGDPKEPPGSWEHFTSFAPPWFTFWAEYSPQIKSFWV